MHRFSELEANWSGFDLFGIGMHSDFRIEASLGWLWKCCEGGFSSQNYILLLLLNDSDTPVDRCASPEVYRGRNFGYKLMKDHEYIPLNPSLF